MPAFEDALAALEAAQVLHCVRKGGPEVRELPSNEDLDVLVRARDLEVAERVLARAGFRHLRTRGHGGHRFYLAFDEATARWRKVDLVSCLRYGPDRMDMEAVLMRRRRVDGVWVASPEDKDEHARRRELGQREPGTLPWRLARRLPVSTRRSGTVVAFLGPDGAGKGSVLAAVGAALPVAATTVYLGNVFGSGRGGAGSTERGAGAPTPASAAVRETAFLLRKAARMWPRVARAYSAAWRGHVVLCDRHPHEVLAIAPPRTTWGFRLERLLFVRLVPRPDRFVVLDAPGEDLFRRKGEHDPELLERWRQAYLQTFVPPGAVVTTTGALQESTERALHVVWQELARRQRWSAGTGSNRTG